MTSPKIPGFEILGKARESSSSVTWRALQRALDRVVFVRSLKPGATELQRDAFESVARAVARIKHPNLIQVFDVARSEDGTSYVVLESVDGQTLAELLQRETQMDPVRAAKIGMAIADALDAAWKQASLIHRNLKPDNVCVAPGGIVKIVDFGNATLIQSGVDPLSHDEGLIVGTPNYMAPEQAQGAHGLDFHADMYGLGCLLYHLLAGVAPFGYEPDPAQVMELQVTGTLPSPRVANPRIPPNFETVLGRLLMKDCGDRYGWWQDAMADLQRVSLGRPITKASTPPKGCGTLAAFGPRQGESRIGAFRRPGAAARVAAREGQRPSAGDTPSALVRGLLWCLLFLAWGVVARHRWNESPAPFPRPASPPAPRARAGALEGPGEVALQGHARPAQPAEPSGLVQVPGANDAVVSADPSVADLPVSLVADVAAALGKGDRAAARDLLTAAAGKVGGAERQRQDALRALSVAGDPNDVVGSFLVDHFKGRKIQLSHRGRELTIEPERYAAGLLVTSLFNAAGTGHPWSLELATVDPAERLRLLGAGPVPSRENRSDEIALALLVLQAGHREWAQRMAGRAPELAPFLLHVASR